MIEKLRGQVTKKRVAVGSKSEHDAVILVTGGRDLRLQRKNQNVFEDPALDALVGKQVELRGRIAGPSFILEDDPRDL